MLLQMLLQFRGSKAAITIDTIHSSFLHSGRVHVPIATHFSGLKLQQVYNIRNVSLYMQLCTI